MSQNVRRQQISSTGAVIGLFSAQPAQIKFHGFIFSNSSTAGSVAFWAPTPANKQNPAVPGNGAGNTLDFTIYVPATTGNAQFWDEAGIVYEDGLFVIASAATVTGVILYS